MCMWNYQASDPKLVVPLLGCWPLIELGATRLLTQNDSVHPPTCEARLLIAHMYVSVHAKCHSLAPPQHLHTQ